MLLMIKNIAIAALMVVSSLCGAQDWPQYQGPFRNGHSPETGLLRSWPEEGLTPLWSADVGIGYGGPVIKDGRVYFLDRDDEVGDTMRCLDLLSGKELWNYSYRAPGAVSYPGTRSVPLVDGDRVYSVGTFGELYCIDTRTHQPLWHHNVWTDYCGGRIPTYGISQCPLVVGDLLVVASQTPGAGVVAYDKISGEEVWKTRPLGTQSYASPTLVTIAGEEQIVMMTASADGVIVGNAPAKGHLVGIRPSDGSILWDFGEWECRITCGMATECGDDRLLFVGGYELGTVMLRIDKNPDGTFTPRELFRTLAFGDHTKPAIFHEGYLYGMYRTNSRRDGMVCMDLEGNIKWKTSRRPDFDRGSIIIADGLMLASDGGSNLYLIDPSGEEFRSISVTDLSKGIGPVTGQAVAGPPGVSVAGRQNWAPMALAGGYLVLVVHSKMVCVKVSA